MDYVRFGNTGLKVSPVCLGCMTYGVPDRGPHPWSLDEEKSRPFIRQALDAGINFYDTANAYSDGTSEEIVGRVLRDFAKRDEIVLATKVFYNWRKGAPNTGGLSRKSIFSAVDDSLRRLGMDYIDLYQTHRWDYDTPIEETMEALHDVVKSGKVRYIGGSSMWAWQFSKALHVAERNGWTRFVSMQPHYNLIYREEEREMLPLCRAEGIAVIPWSPLARGKLTRPWTDDPGTERSKADEYGSTLYNSSRDSDHAVVEAVNAIAQRRGVAPAQVALAWVGSRPGITAPIVGATKPQHIADAVASLSLKLTNEERAELEKPYVPHPISGHA